MMVVAMMMMMMMLMVVVVLLVMQVQCHVNRQEVKVATPAMFSLAEGASTLLGTALY